MQILALDPAARCGFAWSDGRTVYSGAWQLPKDSPGARLMRLAQEIRALASLRGFEAIAYEDAGFGGINRHTQATHNQNAGVIELVAIECNARTLPVKPTTIKAFVAGHGQAKKEQVMRAVETHLGIVTTDSDEADALAVLIWARAHPEGFVSAKSLAKRAKAARKKPPKLF